jgi:hypothetical protein
MGPDPVLLFTRPACETIGWMASETALTVSGKISGGATIVTRPGSGVAVGTGDGTIVAVAVAVGLNAETVNRCIH